MPRPKPKFSDYDHLLDGLNYQIDKENFTIATKVRILCEEGHEFILTIEQIKKTLRGRKHTESEILNMKSAAYKRSARETKEEKSAKANKGWLTRRRMQFLNVLVQISHQKIN